jgi:hypothetical protein
VAYIPYFEEIKGGLYIYPTYCCQVFGVLSILCINTKLEAKKEAYEITLPSVYATLALESRNSGARSDFSVCLCIPLSLPGNGTVRKFPRHRIHKEQQKNC